MQGSQQQCAEQGDEGEAQRQAGDDGDRSRTAHRRRSAVAGGTARAKTQAGWGYGWGAKKSFIFCTFFWCRLHGEALRLRTSPVRSVTPWVEWAVPTTFTERAPEPERSSSNRTVRPGNHGPAKSPGHPIHSVTPRVEWGAFACAHPLGATCAKKGVHSKNHYFCFFSPFHLHSLQGFMMHHLKC